MAACALKWLIWCALILGCMSTTLHAEDSNLSDKDVVVIVDGFAACKADTSMANCRRAAVSDALRRAVEKGVGVFVEGDTGTRDYMLVRDTIRTSAEGFVRHYRIIDERQDSDTCHVTIEATVAPGTPDQSLRHLCKRLREEIDPTFHVMVEDSVVGSSGILRISEHAILNELAALGLNAVAGLESSSPGDVRISIRGHAYADPLGEVIEGTSIFSANASTALSVVDLASGITLPSLNVSLRQPVVGLSRDGVSSQAMEAVSRLWVRRSLPLIAVALLDPERLPPAVREPSEEPAFEPPPIDLRLPHLPSEQHDLSVPEGSRLKIETDALNQLAAKLAETVNDRSEFDSLPVEIAVSRFRTIGISDSALADDVLEDLSTVLVKTRVFELVERSQLDHVLHELRLHGSGLIDSAGAKKLGRLVGAKAVLVGSISDRGDHLVLNARLINTESGRVRVAESVIIHKEPEPVTLRAGPRR